MRIRILLVAFDADPDPEPTFLLNADPYPQQCSQRRHLTLYSSWIFTLMQIRIRNPAREALIPDLDLKLQPAFCDWLIDFCAHFQMV